MRLCGAAHAARTRIRMASEQDEEDEQVSGPYTWPCVPDRQDNKNEHISLNPEMSTLA